MDDELEKILATRAAPQPREGFAARIIAASRAQRENRWVQTLRDIEAQLEQFFLLPRPAYICVAVLLLGVVIGTNIEAEPDLETEELISYLEVYDSLNGGEFL